MTDQSPAFGPSIWAELAAAGVAADVVGLVPFDNDIYKAGTVLYADGVTDDQKAAVEAVVAAYDPTKLSAADLSAYANVKQWSLATGGYTITLSGQPLTFATDEVSQGLITGKYVRLAQANPPASISWQFPAGFVSIASADFQKAAPAIADFIQATFDALEVVEAAIKAGTITTAAQVDAAAWPSAVAAAS